VRPKIGVLVHDVHQRALDEISELERAAELAVALHALAHLARNLHAQVSEFFRRFEFQQSHGVLRIRMQVRRGRM